MKAAERKQALSEQTNNLKVEFSVDDELAELVLDNTRGATKRTVTNIVKCLTLIAGGTAMGTACKLTGITRGRLNAWRTKEWYSRAISIIQDRLDEQLDGKFTHAINKGMNKLHQRLDVGDPVVNNRTGEVTYKPVSAKDAAIITSIFFDKRNLLRNKPTSISSTQSTDERLVELAGKFKQIAEQAVDADFEEIKDDEPIEIINAIEAPKDQGAQENTDAWTFNAPRIKSTIQQED